MKQKFYLKYHKSKIDSASVYDISYNTYTSL